MLLYHNCMQNRHEQLNLKELEQIGLTQSLGPGQMWSCVYAHPPPPPPPPPPPRLHARTHPCRHRWAMQPSTRGHRATARPSCMRACVRGCVRSVKTADKPSQRLTTFDRGLTNFVKPLTNVVKTTLTNLTMPIPWHARTHARTQAFTRVHADTRVNAHARGGANERASDDRPTDRRTD